MLFRRSTTVKYCLAAFVGAVIYCEWFIYFMQTQYWAPLACTDNDASCTKVLFIADPQIQGDLAVPPPWSYLFNWDSDRYLKSTFKVVLNKFKPDILVFMGDLMDEGSISTMPQFHNYVRRLSDIFEVNYDVMQVWIPGDNDIGGENEPIRGDKVKEFEKVFQQPSVVHYQNISFYKVNGILRKFPKMTDVDSKYENNFKIAISHYPITSRRAFGSQVYNEFHPDIFFCAHDHISKYEERGKDLSHRQTTWITNMFNILNISFDDDSLYEIFVPTCSYRMGTSSIGYGAAIFENNNRNMRYTVFWSPTRFPYLFLYLFLLILIILYCLVYIAAKLLLRKKTDIKTADMSPLLESFSKKGGIATL